MPLNLNLPCSKEKEARDYYEQSIVGGDANKSFYPTSINILIGGPCQHVRLHHDGASEWVNSVNSPDSFIQYVVALLMLWMVILMPWILLKIFLDYFRNTDLSETNLVKYLIANGSPVINRYKPSGLIPPSGPGVGPGGHHPPAGSVGKAMKIPYFDFKEPSEVQKSIQAENSSAIANINMANMAAHQSTREANRSSINALQNESAVFSQSAANLNQALNSNSAQMANFNQSTSTQSVSNSSSIGDSSNVFANSQFSTTTSTPVVNVTIDQADIAVLNLANLSIPTITDIVKYETAILANNQDKIQVNNAYDTLRKLGGVGSIASQSEKDKFSKLKEQLSVRAMQGSKVAENILAATKPKEQQDLPKINTLQRVNPQDLQKAKNTWKENYLKLDPPANKNRKDWLTEEVAKLPQVIDMLQSDDPRKVAQGKDMVAGILPFLLLGGFSKSEVVSYLKSKQEAAKEVLDEVSARGSEEDKVLLERKQTEQLKTMAAQQEVPEIVDDQVQGSEMIDQTQQAPSEPHLNAIAMNPGDLKVLNLANLTIPTLDDVVNYETAIYSNDSHKYEQINKVHETLSRIGGTSKLVTPAEKEQFTKISKILQEEAGKGSNIAENILAATKPTDNISIPKANKTQKISLEEYQKIKQTWKENYIKLQPLDSEGKLIDRKEWISKEADKTAQTIDGLMSNDPARVMQAKGMIAKILPFLLLGGFSKAEIISYLKAKLEAAKEALADLIGKNEDERVLIDRKSADQNKAHMKIGKDEETVI